MPRQVGLGIYTTVSAKSHTFFNNKVTDNSIDDFFFFFFFFLGGGGGGGGGWGRGGGGSGGSLLLAFNWMRRKTANETKDFNHIRPKIYQRSVKHVSRPNITKTCLYNFDPLKPHFYIVKLGFTGVYVTFLISAQKHRLWVLVRTASPRRF